MASLRITAWKSHGISFNPLLQHAKNTGLTVKCTDCNKPRFVYSRKKVSVSLPTKSKLATDKLWFTCSATVKELVGTEHQFVDRFIRANLTCQKTVEVIYYSVGSYLNWKLFLKNIFLEYFCVKVYWGGQWTCLSKKFVLKKQTISWRKIKSKCADHLVL